MIQTFIFRGSVYVPDSSGIEDGAEADYEGLGLLDIETLFGEYKKKTIQVQISKIRTSGIHP